MVIIAGGAEDAKTKNADGFFCLAPVSAGQFTISPSILADVPPTRPLTGENDAMGGLTVGVWPAGTPPQFTAKGLDTGYLMTGSLVVKTVQFK